MKARGISTFLVVSCLVFILRAVHAENADVLDVTVEGGKDSRYSFTVTVRHNDTGWDHYADRWEILDMDDRIISARVLRHPHVEEQPFTRSLRYIPVADEISRVKIRAHCSRDGYGGETFAVELPGK